MAKTKAKAPAKTKAAKKPAVKTPAAKKPAAKKPAAKKPAAKKATAKKPPAKTSVAKPSARARGVTVDAYIAGLSPRYRAIAERLLTILQSVAPKATSSIKWGQPVFEHGGPMIWMKAFAKHFALGFWRGAELPDPQGILEGDGNRMRHVKLRAPADIDERAVKALVRAAADANQTKGDPTKRR